MGGVKWWAGVCLLLLGCSTDTAETADGGATPCGSDNDCKGERICGAEGRCVDPGTDDDGGSAGGTPGNGGSGASGGGEPNATLHEGGHPSVVGRYVVTMALQEESLCTIWPPIGESIVIDFSTVNGPVEGTYEFCPTGDLTVWDTTRCYHASRRTLVGGSGLNTEGVTFTISDHDEVAGLARASLDTTEFGMLELNATICPVSLFEQQM